MINECGYLQIIKRHLHIEKDGKNYWNLHYNSSIYNQILHLKKGVNFFFSSKYIMRKLLHFNFFMIYRYIE
jgi:hypothetical protein